MRIKANKYLLSAVLVFIFAILALVLTFIICDTYEYDQTLCEIEGIWYHPKLNCLEGPYNILIFENGEFYGYSSIHNDYEKEGYYKKLHGGEYELTEPILLRSGDVANTSFIKVYNEMKYEFQNVRILENGDIVNKIVTIRAPTKKFMPYYILKDKPFKLRRMTGIAKFEKFHNDFEVLKKYREAKKLKDLNKPGAEPVKYTREFWLDDPIWTKPNQDAVKVPQ